jgi:hypothetical protein
MASLLLIARYPQQALIDCCVANEPGRPTKVRQLSSDFSIIGNIGRATMNKNAPWINWNAEARMLIQGGR